MGKRGTPRASCDPCRRKKVKCDKDQRNAEGISLCSFCCARGYDCIITDDARPNADNSDTDAASAAEASASASTSAAPQGHAAAAAARKRRKKSDAHDEHHPHDRFSAMPAESRAAHEPPLGGSSAEPDMLQVRGLTRSLLDDAIESHFRTTYWCNPAVHPRHFYPRYRHHLNHLEGVATSSADLNTFPPAEILTLAVACVGVVQLGYAPNRFELQARIFRRLEKLVSQACTKDITVALDVLEAILLTFDVPARTRAVEEATTASLDAGYFHPMSHAKMIRLVTYHGLNRSREDPVVRAQRNKQRTPERRVLCDVNDERMPLILAVAAVNDIIRSFDLFHRHQLLQEDIDPDAMMADLGGPIGNQWAYQLSLMASILRTHNLTICAAKSRRQGISPVAVLEVLDQLERFERQIPEVLRWRASGSETDVPSLHELIPHDNTSEDIISILVRKAFLNLLLWSQYRCIHTMVHAHGLQRPTQDGNVEGTLYLRARQRVDSLLLTAIDRMSELCPQLAAISVPPSFAAVNLLDYSSIAFRSSSKGGAYYTLEMAKLTHKAGLRELTADLLSKAGKKIYAFSTYQCHPDTQAEAARMRKLLSSLYSEFELIPGLGSTNEVKLKQERDRFSGVFEPAAAPTQAANAGGFVSDVPWNGAAPTAPVSATAPWAMPGTDDLSTFGSTMTDFLAGLPFGNATAAPTSSSPGSVPFASKTPASTAAAASPFDLNAFLDTQIEPTNMPHVRTAPTNF